MNDEIIEYNGDVPYLAQEISERIAEFEKTIKELKAQEEELKAKIKQAFEDNGVLKLENDVLNISYVESYDKEQLDTKRLRAELPEIYDEYVKITPVKASIRIKTKGA